MKKITIPILLLFFAVYSFSQPMKVEVEGDVSFDNSMYMIKEAGENFSSAIESESTAQVSVMYNSYWDKNDNPNGKWRVNIHKSDVQWNQDLVLQIKRNGNGYRTKKSGANNIHDGDSYQSISNTPSYFFRGKSEILYIPLLFKVNGLSLTLGARDYETNIVLTVYDDW